MRGLLEIAGVYAILDLPYPYPLAPSAIASGLIAGGARVVQLRAKRASAEQRRRWAEAIASTCHAAGVPLIINDDVELAESGIAGVAGVHLGQTDLASLGPSASEQLRRRERLRERGLALGLSTHDLAQLRQADALEPDYVGFGPVFSTTNKLDADPVVGLDELARACGESAVPVVAIGGIDSARAPELARVGVSAIAAIGALTGETVEIIRARTLALVRAFDQGSTV
ncbi:MAG TPA: thiamine phosphate synthase [Enhygromyxa sp.]|nr:thiamine phosphate synthase [Enhygromyxa sp.]